MSVMFEVLYRAPRDSERETRIVRAVAGFGGRLTDVELPDGVSPSEAVTLTIEFTDRATAHAAADTVRKLGEHVEGPQDYGDD